MSDFLRYASAKYYAGEPIISDTEFDALAEKEGFNNVGSSIIDLSRAIPHERRLYSLKKCFVGEPLIELPDETIDTPKLDGAAISVLYINGRYVRALTRGDGKAGLDVTDKVRSLVPQEFDYRGVPVLQVSGEVVAPKHVPNSRNYAAGALNLKSLEEFSSRDLTFIAYWCEPYCCTYYNDTMKMLHDAGFNTVLDSDWGQFPQDGRVIRLLSNPKFQSLGYTDKHPRGAFALKEQQKGVITTLEDVVWQVGRTGVVSPVAILKPVLIGEATVSRATLNNIKYIEELGLELGCEVELIRSGEIIPRILRRV